MYWFTFLIIIFSNMVKKLFFIIYYFYHSIFTFEKIKFFSHFLLINFLIIFIYFFLIDFGKKIKNLLLLFSILTFSNDMYQSGFTSFNYYFLKHGKKNLIFLSNCFYWKKNVFPFSFNNLFNYLYLLFFIIN